MKLLTISDLTARGLGERSFIYDQISKGCLPPPVKLSRRIARWPECEIDRLIGFLVAEPKREELKNFVGELLTNRKVSA